MADGFTGMSQLIADLEALGPKCAHESEAIVDNTAEFMKSEVIQRYPLKDGDLRNGVSVEEVAPTRRRVVSKARHAHLFERGTVARYTHSTGAGRGTMPVGNVFIPAAIKWRARMVEALVAVVKKQKVRGMTGSLDVVTSGD